MSTNNPRNVPTKRRGDRPGAMVDRSSLRLSAMLMLTGQILFIVVTLFHADGSANNHRSVFVEYAGSGSWKAVHVVQFAAIALLLAGLLALFFALDVQSGPARWAGRFGAASAVATLALYGVLQAVDGVGNKMVDAAWVSAPDAEKSARFASAEAMRWLEWGVRSYQDLALLLLAAAVARTVGLPRPIAYLILVAYAFTLAWMIWLVVVAWRMHPSEAHHQAG